MRIAMFLTLYIFHLTLLVLVLISSYRSSFAISAGSKALIVDSIDIPVSYGPTGLGRDISNSSFALFLRLEKHFKVNRDLNSMRV